MANIRVLTTTKITTMKNLYILSFIIPALACTESVPTAVKPMVERSIGFHSIDELQEFKWHLGTEGPIDLVKARDKAWFARDYDAMKNYFVDTLTITTYNGQVFKSFEDFQKNIALDTTGGWTFDRAFSVDLNPATGGACSSIFQFLWYQCSRRYG